MNVLHISSIPKPYGGVANLTFHVLKELPIWVSSTLLDTAHDQEKFHVPYKHVVLPPWRTGPLETLGVLTSADMWRYVPVVLRLSGGARRAISMLRIVKAVDDLVTRGDYDLIHAQHALQRALAGLLVAREHSLPFVVTVIGAEVTHDQTYMENERLTSYVILKSDGIISISDFTDSYIEKRGLVQENRYVIPLGVDTQRFCPRSLEERREIRARYGIKDAHRLILYMAYIRYWKGPEILVKAARSLPQEYRILIAGRSTGYEVDVLRLVEQLSLEDRVKVLTDLPEDALPELYAASDCFVFPTRLPTEGFGLAILEAMASGLPVVASRIAAIPELVKHELSGLLFTVGDERHLAEQIRRACEDEGLRQRIVAGGLSTATEYTWSRTADLTSQVYEEVVEKHRLGLER